MKKAIEEFKQCKNDIERFRWCSDNKDLEFVIVIDNDDIAISFNDENNTYLHFDTSGMDCISCLLDVMGIENEWV